MDAQIVSYNDVLIRYPAQIQEVMAKLKKGKSKHKTATPDMLKWSIRWGFAIPATSFTFADMLAGKHKTAQQEPVKTREEQINDYVGRCGVWLVGNIGKWIGSSDTKIDPTSAQEIYDFKAQMVDEAEADKLRRNSLTPQQVQQEMQQAINTLNKMGGFRVLVGK